MNLHLLDSPPLMTNSPTYGIDGCAGGWVISYYDQNTITYDLVKHLNDVPFKPGSIIAIDMPYRLPNDIQDYPRQSDRSAKQQLGRYHSRVFYAPLLDWLDQPYLAINRICDANQKPKLSKQSFYLFQKIAELQHFAQTRPELRIAESHPELVFHYLNNNQPLASKKSNLGREERLKIIENHLPFRQPQTRLKNSIKHGHDDVMDAIILLWVANQINEKNSMVQSLLF